MNDRKLLELAAKAYDDGDAFRLAVALGISIDPRGNTVVAMGPEGRPIAVETGADRRATARRAVLLVAAKMGKAQPAAFHLWDGTGERCQLCDGYGKYQDGDSGSEEDGLSPNLIDCDCSDSERRPDYREAARQAYYQKHGRWPEGGVM